MASTAAAGRMAAPATTRIAAAATATTRAGSATRCTIAAATRPAVLWRARPAISAACWAGYIAACWAGCTAACWAGYIAARYIHRRRRDGCRRANRIAGCCAPAPSADSPECVHSNPDWAPRIETVAGRSNSGSQNVAHCHYPENYLDSIRRVRRRSALPARFAKAPPAAARTAAARRGGSATHVTGRRSVLRRRSHAALCRRATALGAGICARRCRVAEAPPASVRVTGRLGHRTAPPGADSSARVTRPEGTTGDAAPRDPSRTGRHRSLPRKEALVSIRARNIGHRAVGELHTPAARRNSQATLHHARAAQVVLPGTDEIVEPARGEIPRVDGRDAVRHSRIPIAVINIKIVYDGGTTIETAPAAIEAASPPRMKQFERRERHPTYVAEAKAHAKSAPAETEEPHVRRSPIVTRIDGAWPPAPSTVAGIEEPAAVVIRSPAPRIITHPSPAIVVLPNPAAVAIGSPARSHLRGPHRSVIRGVDPAAVTFERLRASNVGRNVAVVHVIAGGLETAVPIRIPAVPIVRRDRGHNLVFRTRTDRRAPS